MNLTKATVDVLQGILDVFAIPVSLQTLPVWVRILIVCVIFASVGWGLFELVRSGKLWSRAFWRNSGKAVPFLTCLLLMIAYGSAGVHDARPLGGALAQTAGTGLPRLIPLSVLTQLVVTSIFWFGFGRLMDVPWRTLAGPYGSLALGIGGLLLMFPITTVWLALHHAGDRTAFILLLTAFVALIATWAYLAVLHESSPLGRVVWQRGAQHALNGLSQPNLDPRTERMLRRLVEEPPPLTLWPGTRRFLRRTRQLAIAVVLVATLASLPYWVGWLHPPTPAAVLRVELVIYSICLLFAMSQFRDQAFAIPDLPPAMTGFVDLTLTLSAATVAIAALPTSHTTSRGISPSVIAVGPPLLVALIVLVAVLLPNRSAIPRWNTCLAVSGAAAVLMIPLQALVTFAVLPLVGMLPWF
jgi:hypothetical protein